MSLIKIKTEPRRRRGWGRKLFWVGGIFVVLGVVLYFVGTSAAFLKGVILPQVSNALKAEVTVAEADLSPFRRVMLREVKIHPRGSEPLLSIKEIRLRYSLLAIMRGKIEVAEITVESPVLTVVQNADGTSNLDELLKLGDSEKEPTPETVPARAVVKVQLVALNNATVRIVQHHASGSPDVMEVSGLNFRLQDLQNGKSGKLEVSAKVAVDQGASAAAGGASLRAKIGGGFTFELSPDFQPAALQGNVVFTVEQATGALAELAALEVRLNSEATPTEVKQLALRFLKGAEPLGEVRVSGPLDLAKREGKLKLEVSALDRRLLNLAGAASGIDFGPTTINYTTDLEFTKGGNTILVAGRLNVANFQVARAGQTSPPLDLRWDYSVVVDQTAKSATLQFFNLSGTQNSQMFLQSELPNALTIGWGEGGAAANDATFNLLIKGWNLADWRAFAGDAAPTGLVNTQLKLSSQQGGKQLRLELDGGVDQFSIQSGSNRVNQSELRWTARAQATELKQFKLDEYRLEILSQGQTALTMKATGTYDSTTQNSDLALTVQAPLARLLAVVPQPGLTVSAGTVDLKSHILGKAGSQSITGQFALTDFTGAQDELRLANYGMALDFDLALQAQTLEIRKLSGLVREGTTVGGRLDVAGNINLGETITGKLAVNLVEFNEAGLRPFLESALGGKQLVSVSLNTSAAVNLGVTGDTGIKADLQVTNLVVSDAKNPQLAAPLQVRMLVDVTMAGAIAEIRQCQLTLTPTERAKNELNLTGQVDSAKADAIAGNLKLSSAGLDVTRYYDLFQGKPMANAPVKVAPPAPQTAPEPETEPEAMALPFQNFTFVMDLNRFYLREVELAEVQATAKINGGQVNLQPCQMKINGAPVSARVMLDLSVPGYRYDVSFDAQAIPLTPVVNTFMPDRKEQIGGQLIATAQLQGAGLTGSSLQTNLTGNFNVLATNLNLSVNNVRTPIINAIINTIIGLPDLLAGLTGKREGGPMRWADEITARPIDVVAVRGVAGGGRIEVQAAEINSAAFRVQTTGAVELAPVLTDSPLQFPVQVSLGRSHAEKIGLVNANTPTNVVYVALSDFLTIKGTLGNVKSDVSKTGVAVLAAKTAGGISKELGLAVGDLSKTLGDVLRGKPADTKATATATNNAIEPKKPGLLDLFRREKKE